MDIVDIPNKIYFSIGEVSTITKTESYTLRYWETEFNLLKPKKNKAGKRIYTKKDIENVLYIKRLLHQEKYTIEGAKKKLRGTPYPERKQVIQEDIFEREQPIKPAVSNNGEDKQFLKSLKEDILLLQDLIRYNNS